MADRDAVSGEERRNISGGEVFPLAGRRNIACHYIDRHNNTADRNKVLPEEGIACYYMAADMAVLADSGVVRFGTVRYFAAKSAAVWALEADTAHVQAVRRDIPLLRGECILSVYCGCHYLFCLYFCP